MITQSQYERLKTEFGDVASWTIWKAKDTNGKAKSNMSDLELNSNGTTENLKAIWFS